MAEKKVRKTKVQSDYLSDSKSSEDEVNPYLCTSQEERVYGTIKGSVQATQTALSHTRVQRQATSTPRATLISTPETPPETYHQIIPGMSYHLYPTLVADGSLTTHVADNHSTLQNQITSEVDKYLQEVVERHERDVNYFNGQHVATNTSSQQQKANLVEQDEEKALESNGQDTGENGATNVEHDIQYQDELETIPEEEEEEEEEDLQMAAK